HSNFNYKFSETQLNRYISNSADLTCLFDGPCAWMNVPNDGLLDTSDFYLFTKSDGKSFPANIQTGSLDPPIGTRFVLAGNTSQAEQSAVIVSAPIACQRTSGFLIFKYWLYNDAKIETLIVKPTSRRNHLQVILRPVTECHFLRTLFDYCRVEIPETAEPFRIGIRAYGLKDSALGSFGMITDIKYKAEICLEPKFSTLFGARAVPPPLAKSIIRKASELSCIDYDSKCRWSNSISSPTEWKIGQIRERWMHLFGTESKPSGTFFYQYWLKPGTQVQTCTVSATNVLISCVYLSERLVPGPINIDVDAPADEPFRSGVAILRSRKVLCAHKATIFVAYFRTDNAELMICVDKQCVNTEKSRSVLEKIFWYIFSGWLSMEISRNEEFVIRLVAKSTGPSLVIIRKIETAGDWCPLQSLSQIACKKLHCVFRHTFCNYKSEINTQANTLFNIESKGLTAVMNKGSGLAVLRSPRFQISRSLELKIELYQSTFGSQTFLCGDEFVTLFDCRPILGPKISSPKTITMNLRLDVETQNFSIVAVHDKFAEFGPATFVISKIEVVDENGQLIC
ncbi:unnamed protein product, partial [Thelazia callipaeda]|uniref:MAM domain-containing protein n=1 Tax=Thelazia callipaeda TaxID=103827 RepID=A0A0N5CWV4_THECL